MSSDNNNVSNTNSLKEYLEKVTPVIKKELKKEIEKKINKKIQVIDLCWLSDIDIKNLIKLIGKCTSVLIVDECRRSGCYGEGLMVDLQKVSDAKLNIDIHTAENSFIPLGEGATSTLPSKDSIIESAIRMLDA